MELQEAKNGVIIKVKVKTNSNQFGFKNGFLEVTSPPKEGKANLEIIKGLKNMFKKDIQILRGLKSKEKVILIKDAKIEDIDNYV